MASLSSMYSSVRLYAQQCPDATIDKFLIESIREFCRESWYYQQTVLINQVSGTASYTVTPASSEETIAIPSVKQGDISLVPLSLEDAEVNGQQYTGFVFETPSTLIISPTPTTTVSNNIEARVAVMPPENTTTIPESIYRNYKEVIVAGALSKILLLQSESWSNPELAAMKLREFQLGYFKAKGERMRGFRKSIGSIRPRSFAI